MSSNPAYSRLKEPVFVVDDEAEIVSLLVDSIRATGLRCEGFTSPKEALARLESEDPFLIFSDFNMPEMKGLELCAEVRKTRPRLKFILVTAHGDKQTAVAGLSSGVSDLVDKPFDIAAVRAIAEKHAKDRIEELRQEESEIEEITTLFTEEATDLLSDLDQLLLKLEERPIDAVAIDSLFRKIHSVKGGASAVPGGKLLSSLAHDFESLLAKVKKGEYDPDASTISLFLKCADLSRSLIGLLKQRSEADDSLKSEVQAAIASLKSLNSGAKLASAPPAPAASAPAAKPQAKGSDEAQGEDEGIWVSNEKLDSFMRLSGELIVLKNYFQLLERDEEARRDFKKLDKKLHEFAYGLNKLTGSLQDQIVAVRKVSLEKTFTKLPRIVRQTSMEVGKKVRLNMTGLEMGVDKTISKSLSASLVHMVRNSIDHGIEKDEASRVSRGKSPEGQISISAQESQGMIQITVSDDGGGIDPDRVFKKAVQNGLVPESARSQMSDEQVLDLIFLPGFSTAEKVSAVSGRGVGMDVVRSSVLSHNGRVRVQSTLGKGTTFHIEIPVPKAVMIEQTVCCRAGGRIFAVPLTAIARIISCGDARLSQVNGVRTMQFEGRTVPLRTYSEYLSGRDLIGDDEARRMSAVILHFKSDPFGLLVDAVEDQLEAVIRHFDEIVKAIPGFKGTTVLGNEQVAYIVSPESMHELARGRQENASEQAA